MTQLSNERDIVPHPLHLLFGSTVFLHVLLPGISVLHSDPSLSRLRRQSIRRVSTGVLLVGHCVFGRVARSGCPLPVLPVPDSSCCGHKHYTHVNNHTPTRRPAHPPSSKGNESLIHGPL